MTTPLVFPASKTREIAQADPDIKELSKQSIEILRGAAQYFAQGLFSKCFDEARHKKRQTANMSDFINAVNNDETLTMMLGPFFDRPAPEAPEPSDDDDAPQEEHEEDLGEEEEAPKAPLEELVHDDNEADSESSSSEEEEEEEEEALEQRDEEEPQKITPEKLKRIIDNDSDSDDYEDDAMENEYSE